MVVFTQGGAARLCRCALPWVMGVPARWAEETDLRRSERYGIARVALRCTRGAYAAPLAGNLGFGLLTQTIPTSPTTYTATQITVSGTYGQGARRDPLEVEVPVAWKAWVWKVD